MTLARRTTHSLTLTPDGTALPADARRLLAGWDAIAERHARDGPLTGVVRVVAPVALGQGVPMAAVAELLVDAPALRVEWSLTDHPIRFAEEGRDL